VTEQLPALSGDHGRGAGVRASGCGNDLENDAALLRQTARGDEAARMEARADAIRATAE